MKKQNKTYFAIFLFAIFLFASFHFIIAEETSEQETIDIGNLMQLDDLEITGTGVEYNEIEEGFDKGNHRITFQEEDSELKIGKNEFKNIAKGEDSFIDLNKEGKIIKAEFTTNENGGTYIFENQEIQVPPNSKVIFNKETGIIIETSEGEEITNFPSLIDSNLKGYDVKIKGDNNILPDGSVLKSGTLTYRDGKPMVLEGDTIVLDDKEIIPKQGDLSVYINEDCDSLNQNEFYYCEDELGIAINTQENKNLNINLDSSNKYFPNKKISLTSNEGDYVSLTQGDNENPVEIYHESSKNGVSSISLDGKTYPLNKRGIQSLGRFRENIPPFSLVSVDSNGIKKNEFIFKEGSGMVCSIEEDSGITAGVITGRQLGPDSFEPSWKEKMERERERKRKQRDEGTCYTGIRKKSYKTLSVDEQINTLREKYSHIMKFESDYEKTQWLYKYNEYKRRGVSEYISIKYANYYFKKLRAENKGGSSSLAGSINLRFGNMQRRNK